MTNDSKQRFSNRVNDYIKFRPSYPPGVIETLRTHFGLNSDSVVVDVGAGTGISSELFLNNGNLVFGVEPNESMRKAAENMFQNNKNITAFQERQSPQLYPINVLTL